MLYTQRGCLNSRRATDAYSLTKTQAKYFLRRSCIYTHDLYTSSEFTEGTQTSVSITLVRLSHVCILAITTRSVLMCYLFIG